MATLPFEDEDLPGKIIVLPTSGGSTGGGAPTTAGPAAAPSAAPAAPGTGTGFVNLETYLGLNQGAGMGMANTLAGGLEQGAQQVRQGVDALSGQFDDAARQGRAVAGAQPYTGPAANAEQLAAANGNTGARGYTGPASLQAMAGDQYTRLGAQASDVAARGRQAQSGDAGALLQGQYGQGREYGTGARGLDSFLTTTGGAGDRLRQGGAATNSLEKYLGLADKRAGATVGAMSQPAPRDGAGGTPRGPETPDFELNPTDLRDPRERRRLRGGGGKSADNYERGF
ncbi:MAG TPA: hypothetical protein VMY76_00725 [Gemmatimonadales bacterium]|nr:hypothetical protein [Gemmatimonadales bacterium]